MYKRIGISIFIISLISASSSIKAIRIELKNNTAIQLKIAFTCAIYKTPTIVTIRANGQGKAYLDDLTDKDITKDTTVKATGNKLHPASWTFKQTELPFIKSLTFATDDNNMFALTIEKSNGATYIQQPDGQ